MQLLLQFNSLINNTSFNPVKWRGLIDCLHRRFSLFSASATHSSPSPHINILLSSATRTHIAGHLWTASYTVANSSATQYIRTCKSCHLISLNGYCITDVNHAALFHNITTIKPCGSVSQYHNHQAMWLCFTMSQPSSDAALLHNITTIKPGANWMSEMKCTLSLARWSKQTNAMGTLRFLTSELCSRVDNALSSCWNVRQLFTASAESTDA